MKAIVLLLCSIALYTAVQAQCTGCTVEITYDASGRRVLRETVLPTPTMRNPLAGDPVKDSTPLQQEAIGVTAGSSRSDRSTLFQTATSQANVTETQAEPGVMTNPPAKLPGMKGYAVSNRGEVMLYPVPVAVNFTVYSRQFDFRSTRLTIYNMLGKKVLETTVGSDLTVDVSELQDATYYVELHAVSGEQFVVSIIKQY